MIIFQSCNVGCPILRPPLSIFPGHCLQYLNFNNSLTPIDLQFPDLDIFSLPSPQAPHVPISPLAILRFHGHHFSHFSHFQSFQSLPEVCRNSTVNTLDSNQGKSTLSPMVNWLEKNPKQKYTDGSHFKLRTTSKLAFNGDIPTLFPSSIQSSFGGNDHFVPSSSSTCQHLLPHP